jgi:hypothetical protein
VLLLAGAVPPRPAAAKLRVPALELPPGLVPPLSLESSEQLNETAEATTTPTTNPNPERRMR